MMSSFIKKADKNTFVARPYKVTTEKVAGCLTLFQFMCSTLIILGIIYLIKLTLCLPKGRVVHTAHQNRVVTRSISDMAFFT